MDEEKIEDIKVAEKFKVLEKAVHEGKEGVRNQHLQDIA